MKKRELELPTTEELSAELDRVRYKSRFGTVMRSTLYSLVIVAAVAVLVATLWLPVLRIYGASMTPTLSEADIVVSVKDSNLSRGDIVSFYYNNKILVKRVIALPGEWVEIDGDGNIYINGELLEEPYLQEKALGECDLEFPYQVPEGRIFVCGDHRDTSVDSRSTTVGCVAEEQIVGRIVFRVWPLADFGWIA